MRHQRSLLAAALGIGTVGVTESEFKDEEEAIRAGEKQAKRS